MNSPDQSEPQAEQAHFRSPLLMNNDDSALLVIDVQERLAPHVDQIESVKANIAKLIQAAEVLDVALAVSEQYPKGLGSTVPELGLPDQCLRAEKTMFSCRECEALLNDLNQKGVHKLLLVGMETHVCVAQTAFDLISSGFEVYLAIDAVGSRNPIDHQTAIRRMEMNGVTVTTTEAAMFEWCVTASHDRFKQISALVK